MCRTQLDDSAVSAFELLTTAGRADSNKQTREPVPCISWSAVLCCAVCAAEVHAWERVACVDLYTYGMDRWDCRRRQTDRREEDV
mmetsp:Transcript_4877/g.11322  ORF Transcript_4877/g.11322 Transcript_4877/m.11322 type:complete len:85 (-) Transcript_4877:92-346(-)